MHAWLNLCPLVLVQHTNVSEWGITDLTGSLQLDLTFANLCGISRCSDRVAFERLTRYEMLHVPQTDLRSIESSPEPRLCTISDGAAESNIWVSTRDEYFTYWELIQGCMTAVQLIALWKTLWLRDKCIFDSVEVSLHAAQSGVSVRFAWLQKTGQT